MIVVGQAYNPHTPCAALFGAAGRVRRGLLLLLQVLFPLALQFGNEDVHLAVALLEQVLHLRKPLRDSTVARRALPCQRLLCEEKKQKGVMSRRAGEMQGRLDNKASFLRGRCRARFRHLTHSKVGESNLDLAHVGEGQLRILLLAVDVSVDLTHTPKRRGGSVRAASGSSGGAARLFAKQQSTYASFSASVSGSSV